MALVSVSFFFVVLMTLAFLLALMGILKGTLLAIITGISGVLALIFLASALIQFPVMLPDAFQADNWCFESFYRDITLNAPWIFVNGTHVRPSDSVR